MATANARRYPDLQARLDRLDAAMVHRGPDDGGSYISPDGLVGLANRRLAIQDLSPAGHMPMTTADSTVWITYNGELYNAPELRLELEARGCHFRSHTDTEVILQGFVVWGEAVVERLRGMFAFAIHDQRTKRLFLARDALGIKPLYWLEKGNVFAFASECRALGRAGVAGREVSSAGLVAYLELGSVPAPLTIYRDIRALEAGQMLRICLDGSAPRVEGPSTYWRLPTGPMRELAYREAVEHVHDVLLDSVRRHLVSDAPLGVFLSGGVDSGSVVALMREASPGATIRTCSVSFAEAEFDESPLARQVAQALATEHVDVRVTAEDVRRELDNVLAYLDQPSNDGINTYFVSRAARQSGLAVALSGLGGDELFGGYPSFRRLPVLMRLAPLDRLPGVARLAQFAGGRGARYHPAVRLGDWVGRAGFTPAAFYLGLRGLFAPSLVARLVRKDVMDQAEAELDLPGLLTPQVGRIGDGWDVASRFELTGYMRHQLLRDTDAMGMAHSLEVRVPFVDQHVAEQVLTLSSAIRSGTSPKALLRDAVPGLPAIVRERQVKQGFTFPLAHWMRGPLRPTVRERVHAAGECLREVLDPGAASGILDAFERGHVHWSRVWALLALTSVGEGSTSAQRETTIASASRNSVQ